jgi:hypothetical protein
MMQKAWRIISLLILVLAVTVLPVVQAGAYEQSAIQLSYDPPEDSSNRYMFQLALRGAQVSPGAKDAIEIGEYLIGTVFKDTVTEKLMGLNRHRMTFYEYNALVSNIFGDDRLDPRFGGSDFPDLPSEGSGGGGGGGGGDDEGGDGGGGGGGGRGGGGDGGGGGGGGGGSTGGSFIDGLGLPSSGSPAQGVPHQMVPGGGGGGRRGGGGSAGQTSSAIGLNTIRVTNLDYVENKRGEVLDVQGLDILRKVSQNQLVQSAENDRNYIDINISHLFEWSHLLYVPDYPVYKDDIWFHSFPIHPPGLPYDKPIMTKFMYQLVDFRIVGTRKLAVIDMSGVSEWNMKWETRTSEELTEFKSWGKQGISTRYWFDYEKGVLFGMERPPFYDYQYNRQYDAINGTGLFIPYAGTDFLYGMRFPGQVVSMEFFYNTRVTDISGRPRLTEVEPEELRRFIGLTVFNQLEAE